MSRRWLLLGVGVVGLLVAGFALFSWLATPAPIPGITWGNFLRLRMFMSVKDVEGLLGEKHQTHKTPTYTQEFWGREDEAIISVCFVKDRLWCGRAVRPGSSFGEDVPCSLLDRIRWWLGRY